VKPISGRNTPALLFLLVLFFIISVLLSAQEGRTEAAVLSWNIESGGTEEASIAARMNEIAAVYDVALWALSEVPADAARELFPKLERIDDYTVYMSELRGNDRLAFLIDNSVFQLLELTELREVALVTMRPAFAAELLHRPSGREILIILVHLARSPNYMRYAQSRALRIWAARKYRRPVFIVGDFNYDWDIDSRGASRDPGFDILTDDDFMWAEPAELVASQFSDGNRDGSNDYNSILDFVFYNEAAAALSPESRILQFSGDFPDDETSSDHRPVLTLLRF
jgi:endonuclease/exonuclease/phosphatase family metal-dependent hydrolase